MIAETANWKRLETCNFCPRKIPKFSFAMKNILHVDIDVVLNVLKRDKC